MESRSPYTSDCEFRASFCAQEFVPDGDLNKPAWQKALRVAFDHDWMGQRHYPGCSTQVASLWTPSHYYFAFWCKYIELNLYAGDDPTLEKFGLWDRDVAEVFLNPFPERVNRYFEFEVAPNNQWIDLEVNLDADPSFDEKWDSRFLHATRIDAGQHLWTCEMRIPAAAMGAPPIRAGAECRVNFYRCDGPGDDTQRRFLAWSPTLCTNPSDYFHVPTRFGKVLFD